MARQIEFPLSVAICAWCRPHELGTGIGAVSHGICPSHLRKLKLQMQSRGGMLPARAPRKTPAVGNEALLLPL